MASEGAGLVRGRDDEGATVAGPRSGFDPSRGPWTPRIARYDWRSFLTAEETATLAAADAAKAEWKRLNAERASIQNRAIQRAKYVATHRRPS